ncbi:ORFL62W [Human betaherpesvirus 5]|nr:ORFL62W [Human betaherpesvirus 5]QHX40368.1 ORFL62W [Human betaherpesvirus 5]
MSRPRYVARHCANAWMCMQPASALSEAVCGSSSGTVMKLQRRKPMLRNSVMLSATKVNESE